MLTLILECRHWKEVMRITGRELDLTPETFKLQHLLNAKLLAHKDEVCSHCVNQQTCCTLCSGLTQGGIVSSS